ncbi:MULTISPECIES: rhodanese-like domain-containing protein [Paenibacillus]|uniref:Sulfurtransferase n=1 Tax=Paenibacillus helianthi TaxID=1349432 RepID=A0ABX3EZ82_9BACL|nr:MULTISPECIES: rhodanese-like domain-containing protein [Paenibacillus]OKP80025.1 sulfurtransferase [Paenibacillus sp. P3E]OKP82556.1 sulfurtransferase [Paenibacillus sp. P32E]OKP92053.1 sulfurtransferase [Paenibacillus helianthi]OKP96815.1 sulfurtransferase [Paenibacillus sp. P46E]
MNEIPQITAGQLRQRLESGEDLVLIDVREDDEVAFGMIPGAQHIPMGEIPQHTDELPKEAELIFICRSGARSQRVCEYLQQFGFKTSNLSGGMIDWNETADA